QYYFCAPVVWAPTCDAVGYALGYVRRRASVSGFTSLNMLITRTAYARGVRAGIMWLKQRSWSHAAGKLQKATGSCHNTIYLYLCKFASSSPIPDASRERNLRLWSIGAISSSRTSPSRSMSPLLVFLVPFLFFTEVVDLVFFDCSFFSDLKSIRFGLIPYGLTSDPRAVAMVCAAVTLRLCTWEKSPDVSFWV
ncbi:hypothetical protein BHE74_00047791, partial [Ensete ventricosum]